MSGERERALDLVASIFHRAGQRLTTPTTKGQPMSVTALNPTPEPQPSVVVETITPEMAEEYLHHNTRNRKLKPGVVEKLAHAIRSGQWKFNGQPIVFGSDGVLLQGQHRLTAVVVTGIAIVSVVIREVDPAAQITMDNTPGRHFGEVLQFKGEKNTNVLAAAVRALHRFKYGDAYQTSSNAMKNITFDDLLWVLEQHPGIRQSILKTDMLRRRVKVPAGPMAGLHYVLWELSPLDADAFYEKLGDGLELTATNPIYQLRRTFINDATSPKKLSVRHRLALTIKAWNLWIVGDELQNLRWRSGGAAREDFPTPLAPPDGPRA